MLIESQVNYMANIDNTYCDRLRQTLQECGLPVSPIIRRGEDAALRFDAIDVTETSIIFLWLGKPVHMARRNQDHLVHMVGEMTLSLH